MLITLVLLYSCIATPVQIALWDELTGSGRVFNWVVDGLFLADILIIFNAAVYDDDFEIINNRATIV